VFVLIGTNPIYYVGTGRMGPTVALRPHYRPVINDLTGEEPLDDVFASRGAVTTVDFTRFDETVLRRIESFPNRGTSQPGVTLPGDIGAMMIAEGLAYPLYLWYSRGGAGPGANAPMIANGMPVGRRYIASRVDGDIVRKTGSQPGEVHIAWLHRPVLVRGGAGGTTIYDFNLSALNVGMLS
jgi:hypothetical protein